MTALRHTVQRELQKEVFSPSDEKLLCVCHVSKAYKKKKSFLCLTTALDNPGVPVLYQVKRNDKNVFKKKQSWPLADVQVLKTNIFF